MNWQDFATKYLEQEGTPHYEGSLLSLDPGGTTGWAYFKNLEMITCGQLDTNEVGQSFEEIQKLCQQYSIFELVYEDYRVYKWKAKQHAGSQLHTTRVIGAIESVCHVNNIGWINQPANVAKGFCTDKRLKDWGLWIEGQKHARDAIRHACYYILFGGRDKWHQKAQTQKNQKTVG